MGMGRKEAMICVEVGRGEGGIVRLLCGLCCVVSYELDGWRIC
jgi:hypothetical protein